MNNLIASSVPGRLRLRVPAFDADGRDALAGSFEALPGVLEVSQNPRVASVLVRYDPATLPRKTIELKARKLLAANDTPPADGDEGPDPDDTVLGPAPVAIPRRKWRLVVNRYAKYGAVAAMGISLLAIAARRKGLHTQAGILALVFTGIHMYVHRRNLLR
ncbi:MAG: hypothetical protein CGU28_13405 [Candidatus Dactylopiibacterium carminicum]|uniref:HMA domain-containing protein n=1 Tax=Candidatus Dactylopiibacterium carminicum TaxID=857335 RepID=A0A272EP38_9RHOO|nr:hypothetical protein [Candidatus Dactylopiibacterium carminicum]KAF7598217.1 hypothetical protein BGI27_14480 [Candidatus Dactylopiibacterium carminicum]PAS91869.1 MAG: hypothetical protein CGU29_14100 [Candidatus Dactylopiibacterium carminicum]PAS94844.1 MAG: hypothetical protein CGU28_13405 [Candidatus Dactylopiibacterium carminicum]PAS97012.1 MAG: hypothetical protein BSR46_14515 [Candidatus Dactylopiibacterium carminicum]